MSKCIRCNREITNPRARYGPVCAKIVGIDEEYYRADTKEAALAMVKNNFAYPLDDKYKINLKAYEDKMISYMTAIDRGDLDRAARELAAAQKILNNKKVEAEKNAPKGIDQTEFGKGSLAYQHIDILKKMYEQETNPNKKDKISAEIRNAENHYRERISETVLEGVPDLFFDKDHVQGIWTSPKNSFMRIFGYMDAYDDVFDALIDTNLLPVNFTYKYMSYKLEFWKADYNANFRKLPEKDAKGVDMGMGAEIGLYSRYDSTYIERNASPRFEAVKEDDYIKMSFSLYDRSDPKSDNDYGTLLFSRYPQEHWWLTGFKPDAKKIKADELRMVGEITFKDKEMKEAFLKAYNKIDDKRKKDMYIKESNIDSAKIYFDWKTN